MARWWTGRCRQIAQDINLLSGCDNWDLSPRQIEVIFMEYERLAEKEGLVIVPWRKVYFEVPIPWRRKTKSRA